MDNELENGAEAVEEAVPTTEGEAGPQEPEQQAEPAEGEASPEKAADALPPLSNVEYQKRHENVTKALREERDAKRAIRNELAELRAEFERTKTTAPQQFERHQITGKVSEYQQVDWEKWFKQNPQAAEQGLAEFQGLAARLEQLDKADQQQTQQTEQQRQVQAVQQVVNTLASQEEDFRSQRPDYDDACEFLKTDLAKEARSQGYFGDQTDQYVNSQLLIIGQRVHAAGQDMAEHGYNLAIEKGYKPKTADIASLKAGEAAAKTLSNVGGKSSNAGGSFEETMSGLNGAAAASYWEKVKRDQHA
jgi:hypothetical protein